MTFLINAAMEHISIGTAGLVAVMGYAVVFLGLILLMFVIMLAGKIMVSAQKKKKAAAAAAPQTAAPAAAKLPAAPGTAGELMLHDVDPKTAAMAMAIVANKMGKPINELRFKSIKEVK